MTRQLFLDWLRLIRVSGADRIAFLQGQLTQDVHAARHDATLLAGWADPKGRLLLTGELFARDDALFLTVPATLAEALVARLRLFVLRAKVTIGIDDARLVGILDAGADPAGVTTATGNLALLRPAGAGSRLLVVGPAVEYSGLLGSLGAASAPATDWQLAEIRAGIPAIAPATAGEFVPQMVNLDLLGGISFTKGCYTGQEIVARTKYLGRVKRRMFRFASAGPPPEPGAPVFGQRGTVGQVVCGAPTEQGSEFLAVVSLDDLPGPLGIDEARTVPLTNLPLPYGIPELAA